MVVEVEVGALVLVTVTALRLLAFSGNEVQMERLIFR